MSDLVRSCTTVLDLARTWQILLNLARSWQALSDIVWYCLIFSDIVKYIHPIIKNSNRKISFNICHSAILATPSHFAQKFGEKETQHSSLSLNFHFTFNRFIEGSLSRNLWFYNILKRCITSVSTFIALSNTDLD